MQKPWEIDATYYQEESELIQALRRRERMACTCLLKRYASRLYHVALRMVGDADEAEDVIQESFIEACRKIEQYRGDGALGAWLQRIVVNACFMRLRRKRAQTVPIDEQFDLESASPRPELWVLDRELSAELRSAIEQLPESLRTALIARDIEHYSTEEAAKLLQITPSALKVRLHRARAALREILAQGSETAEPAIDHLTDQLLETLCTAEPSPSIARQSSK